MRPIDADALEERIMGEPPDAHYPSYYADMVKKSPTLDVQPVRRGEWVVSEYEYLDCSECGESMYTGCNSTKEAMALKDHWKPFCPNCGADMRKVSE